MHSHSSGRSLCEAQHWPCCKVPPARPPRIQRPGALQAARISAHHLLASARYRFDHKRIEALSIRQDHQVASPLEFRLAVKYIATQTGNRLACTEDNECHHLDLLPETPIILIGRYSVSQ